MKKLKPLKRTGEAHISKSKFGSGDYYGVGVKQPVGKSRVDMLSFSKVTDKKIKTPPKSLA